MSYPETNHKPTSSPTLYPCNSPTQKEAACRSTNTNAVNATAARRRSRSFPTLKSPSALSARENSNAPSPHPPSTSQAEAGTRTATVRRSPRHHPVESPARTQLRLQQRRLAVPAIARPPRRQRLLLPQHLPHRLPNQRHHRRPRHLPQPDKACGHPSAGAPHRT